MRLSDPGPAGIIMASLTEAGLGRSCQWRPGKSRVQVLEPVRNLPV
jgi:hypothetical protein